MAEITTESNEEQQEILSNYTVRFITQHDEDLGNRTANILIFAAELSQNGLVNRGRSVASFIQKQFPDIAQKKEFKGYIESTITGKTD